MLTLDVQRESSEDVPEDGDMRRAAESAFAAASLDPQRDTELSVRVVDREEMRELNARYRQRDKPTNVLSFPVDLPPGVNAPLLGDIVLCAPVVRDEAHAQGKSLQAHWDHMLVHGILHLLGYDHESEHDATVMEALERRALASLGWPCPYESPVTLNTAAAGGA